MCAADKTVYPFLCFFHFRFLATGESFASLSFSYRMGKSTVPPCVKQVVRAIWTRLAPRHLPFPQSAEEWKIIAEEFEERWDFPNCIGALDGKHVAIQAPPNSGSEFFNYKGHFSIVLMALVDANLKFIGIEVGAAGRNSDGGIFSKSNLGQGFINRTFAFPEKRQLPRSQRMEPMPYVIVADEAFPLKENIMRPYPGRGQSESQKIFNYRLSRARRTSENCFALFSARWRIAFTRLAVDIDLMTEIVKTACVLHNMCTSEREMRRANAGEVRVDPIYQALGRVPLRASRNAAEVRESFKEYFVHAAPVPWQTAHVNRGLRA